MPDSAKEAAKLDIQSIMTIAREDRSANRPTDSQRNYNLAKQQGYTGSFMDYQAATKGGTTVNVGPNEGEFAKKAAGKLSDRFAAIVDEGDTACNDLALVSQLRDLGGVIQTGGGAAAQAWLANWGIKVGSNVGAVEAYQSIVDKLTPSQRVPGSGTTSERDMATFKGSLPSLIKTPEGNAIVQNVLSSLAQSKIDRAQVAERVLTGEISAKDGVAELRKLPDPFAAMKGGATGQPAPAENAS
jgi:flagellar protein FlgJ